MGFLDKVQATMQQGQEKIDDLQAKKKADALLRDLGAWYYAGYTGRDAGRGETEIARILGELQAHEAEHGPLGGDKPAEAAAPAAPAAEPPAAGAVPPPPPIEPPPAGAVPPPPPAAPPVAPPPPSMAPQAPPVPPPPPVSAPDPAAEAAPDAP